MPSEIPENSKFVNKVCSNTKSDFIEITEDKLKNILSIAVADIKRSQSWLTPFTLFISILLSVLTADFNKDFLSIPKDVWASIFYLSLLLSLIWLIWKVIISILLYKKTRIDHIIKKIKNDI